MIFLYRSPWRYNDISMSKQRHLQDKHSHGVRQLPIVSSTIGGNKSHSISVPSKECSITIPNEKTDWMRNFHAKHHL